MTNEIRNIKNKNLTDADIKALDGAPLLDPDDLDEAIIGVDGGAAVYDYQKLIAVFQRLNGWSYDDAVEWVDYNTLRALPYTGERCPRVWEELGSNDDPDAYDADEVAHAFGKGFLRWSDP